MNTESATQTSHQGPEALHDRTILERAEMARLIRKLRRVIVGVFVSQHAREQVVPGTAGECFIIEVTTKQALQKLERGDFDTHLWEIREGDLWISNRVAPAALQIARRREILNADLAEYERWLARAGIDADYAARVRGYIAEAKSKLARLEFHAVEAAA